MYVDTHCHLNHTDYGVLSEEIARFQSADVGFALTVGFDLPSSQESVQIAADYPGVYAAVGYHPTELHSFREGDFDTLIALAGHPKCVAWGEIGLDYHYPDTDKPLQEKFFLTQLEIAHSLKLPVSIHSRDDAEDMYRLLKDNRQKLEYGAVLHCYSHSAELCREFLKLGLYIAFGGTVTFSNAKKVAASAKLVPSDRLLTETDSPYLAPVPFRGTFPNSPRNIPVICQALAALREEPLFKTQSDIQRNTEALFLHRT